jgi:hypothetical protein
MVTVCAWIADFLNNRSVRVKVLNSLSYPKIQAGGVPQSSVLGPLCFVLFINNIVGIFLHCSGKLFADDVNFIINLLL